MANIRASADHPRTTQFPVGLYGLDEFYPADAPRRAWEDGLYFIATTAGEPKVKIGRSVDPARRLVRLQTGSPIPLQIVCVLPRLGWQEPVWHAAFRRYRQAGEWFRATDDLVDAVKAARDGEQWIASLQPPASFRTVDYGDRALLAFNVDQRPESLRICAWRDLIADLEEETYEALLWRDRRVAA